MDCVLPFVEQTETLNQVIIISCIKRGIYSSENDRSIDLGASNKEHQKLANGRNLLSNLLSNSRGYEMGNEGCNRLRFDPHGTSRTNQI